MATPPDERSGLVKSLGLWDVTAMTIVAVVGLRWIARSARIGAPAVTLWVLACLTFFVPLAACVAELSSRYPEQGGLYAWTRRAFGPAHGFICGWCLWVNNLFYFPSLLLFAAANALAMFGSGLADLSDSRAYSVAFVMIALWLCIWLNVIGLEAGKWLQTLGTIGTWIPAALLIVFGSIAFATFGSATSFAPRELLPRRDVLGTISLWSALCFAFSGFEITSLMGQEVKHPRRTIPFGISLAGLATTVIYLLGAASILVAVPATALAERSGITDAVDLVSERLGLRGLGSITGELITLGAVAGTSSWIAGAARVPFAAGVDEVMPAAFARLHPRHRTPHIALLIQGAASSLIFLGSVFLTVAGARTTVQEAYDILVNLTILIYFIPYLYLFPAVIRLRRLAAIDAGGRASVRTFQIPGGVPVLWLVGGIGFLATAVSVGLVFVPPTGTANILNFEANIIGQSALILIVGMALYRYSRRKASPSIPPRHLSAG